MSEPISNDSSGVEGHATAACDVASQNESGISASGEDRKATSENQASPAVTSLTCWSCKKPLTEKLDLDLAELPNRGEPMCGACRGRDAD